VICECNTSPYSLLANENEILPSRHYTQAQIKSLESCQDIPFPSFLHLPKELHTAPCARPLDHSRIIPYSYSSYHIYIPSHLLSLVDIERLHLIIRLAQLLVLTHEYNLCNPGQRKRCNRKGCRTAQCNDVAWLVGFGP
jgi:hypothetical protein